MPFSVACDDFSCHLPVKRRSAIPQTSGTSSRTPADTAFPMRSARSSSPGRAPARSGRNRISFSSALPWASCCSSRVLSCLWKSRIIRDVCGPRQRAVLRQSRIIDENGGGGVIICNYTIDARDELLYHSRHSKERNPSRLWDSSGRELYHICSTSAGHAAVTN